MKLVKQKKRKFSKLNGVREKVDKLLQAGYVREFKCYEWLSNMVMVKRSNGK